MLHRGTRITHNTHPCYANLHLHLIARNRRNISMYTFVTAAFGACSVRLRKQRCSIVIVEVETFFGFSRIVSTYRYEAPPQISPTLPLPSEPRLCRYAVAQFLRRSEPIHIARVELLNIKSPPYLGKLTSQFSLSCGRPGLPHGNAGLAMLATKFQDT